ncbi:MAG: sulfate permease, partial [Parvularculaceae bacterium]|nr:sulfate permease [Parvularculaceae bacterium]
VLSRYLPILQWGRSYDRCALSNDMMASVIVTIMLIPQSLAYALIAGLPPEAGLYASITPLVAYAVFGTSSTLAVGPVAVVSLMTAVAVGEFARSGEAPYAQIAMALALMTGLILLVMGALRLGFLANFLSHPIISGFITASGVLIAATQAKHILGISAGGDTLVEIVIQLFDNLGATNPITLAIGVSAIGFLWASREFAKPALLSAGVNEPAASVIARAAPLLAVIVSIAVAAALRLDQAGVAIVGETPRGLPALAVPHIDRALIPDLAAAALLIAIIGYVESVSVAQTLAAKRRERIDLDQELIGLGASNVAAGFAGGFPVTGGFARSVVNFDAGARTPAAGAFTAIGIAFAAMYLTPYLFYLPKAVLSATIIVAVLSLIDIGAIKRTFRYSKGDFAAMLATIAGVFGFGVEAGVIAGVALSISLLLYRSSRPHWAVVGQVPGTEHFRNVRRHQVVTSPKVVSIRIDSDLYFANARFLEDRILALIADAPEVEHVVLMCSAISNIDASALESLEETNMRLEAAGVKLHLSEVKGPVMDRLKRSDFLERLTGRIYLSEFEAMHALAPETFTAPEK